MIHPTAEVEEGATIGANTRIWHYVHVRTGALIGSDCILGMNVYVDSGAIIGNKVKLQNRVSVYRGVTLEDGVFVGPHATFTNDKYPRAITPEGELIDFSEWRPAETLVKHGASIGANVTILPGVTIGRWAMIGAGAVVTRDVPDHGFATGTPAVVTGYACYCGRPLQSEGSTWVCSHCGSRIELPALENGA